jgi:tetratricopeptide (TPR) repeat protein
LELVVVLCLSACYYFLVRNFALGVGNDHTNNWVFTACGKSTFNLDFLYNVWKGRLAGLLLSGSMFDWVVKADSYRIDQYARLFGLYQGLWLLALLLTILVAVRRSLLVNLGIFAGLIYNFLPSAGFYFYPWDLPGTVFLTLSVLLFERGHRGLMLAAIGVGCLFKETVLVGGILCLFCREWKWRWRILSFVGLAAFYMLSKRYLISAFHLRSAVLSMGDATNLRQLLRTDFLVKNLKLLFSSKAPEVLFANAGTLVAVLVVGWEKRFRPYLWLIGLFVAGHLLYGALNEVRIFMQVLPLSCLMLSEYTQVRGLRSVDAASLPEHGSSPSRPGTTGGSRVDAPNQIMAEGGAVKGEGAWAGRKSDVGLTLITVVMLVGTSILVAWDYCALLQARQPEYQTLRVAKLETGARRGEADAQYALGNHYYLGLGVATNLQEAFFWYREAAGRGHVGAQLRLGLCSLRGEGTSQSYEESIRWFRRMAAQGNQPSRCYYNFGYVEGISVKPHLVDRFANLAWLGPLALAAAGLSMFVGFVRQRKSTIDPALSVAVVLAAGALTWQWRYGGVEPLWQGIITNDPNYNVACNNLGYALVKTGQLDEAIACLQKAIVLQPLNPELYYILGGVFYKKGQLDEAMAQCRKTVELRPEVADARYTLGNVLLQQGQLDEAIRQYQEALRLKPDFGEASTNLLRALRLKEIPATQPAPSTKP